MQDAGVEECKMQECTMHELRRAGLAILAFLYS